MKTAILLLGLLCGALLQAQPTPWKGIVGGAFGYSNWQSSSKNNLGITYTSNSTYQTSLNPYFAYRIKPLWAVGAKGSIYFNRNSGYNSFQMQEYSDSYITGSVGLFARRYFTLKKTLQLFVEPSLNYSLYNKNYDNANVFFPSKTSVKEFNATIAPGMAWGISKHFNLVARFGQLIYAKGNRHISGGFTTDYPYHYLNLRLNTATFLLGAELMLGGGVDGS